MKILKIGGLLVALIILLAVAAQFRPDASFQSLAFSDAFPRPNR